MDGQWIDELEVLQTKTKIPSKINRFCETQMGEASKRRATQYKRVLRGIDSTGLGCLDSLSFAVCSALSFINSLFYACNSLSCHAAQQQESLEKFLRSSAFEVEYKNLGHNYLLLFGNLLSLLSLLLLIN